MTAGMADVIADASHAGGGKVDLPQPWSPVFLRKSVKRWNRAVTATLRSACGGRQAALHHRMYISIFAAVEACCNESLMSPVTSSVPPPAQSTACAAWPRQAARLGLLLVGRSSPATARPRRRSLNRPGPRNSKPHVAPRRKLSPTRRRPTRSSGPSGSSRAHGCSRASSTHLVAGLRRSAVSAKATGSLSAAVIGSPRRPASSRRARSARIRRSHLFGLEFTRPVLPHEAGFVRASIVRRHEAAQRFYGQGPESDFDDQSSFGLSATQVDATVGVRLTRWLTGSAGVGFANPDITESSESSSVPPTQGEFDDTGAPGLSFQPEYVISHIEAAIDTRNAGNPGVAGCIRSNSDASPTVRAGPTAFRTHASNCSTTSPSGT